jgi:iron complex transport system ATP-binding protein
MLCVEGLRAGYGETSEVIHGLSFNLAQGEYCCIIGANGCGKTTALRTILGFLKPLGGSVTLDGQDVLAMGEKERAKRFAYIPQMHGMAFPYSVKDLVLLGRTPYLGAVPHCGPEDRAIAYAALCQLGIQGLAEKSYTELSGGQQQLVLIARALAQQPDVLVMDEPTAALDFGNQQLVLSRMRDLADLGMSVLMVTHDPAHAFYCADKVVVICDGVAIAVGTPRETITPQTMRRIYGVEVRIERVELPGDRVGYACLPLADPASKNKRYLRYLRKKNAS